MKTFKQVVEYFEQAANDSLVVNTFQFGTIDKLDASNQNVEYPYVFLRPVTSPGIVLNPNGVSGTRTLTFELYSLDVPKLTDSDYLGVMSDTEQTLYDIIGYANRGAQQQNNFVTLVNIAPVNEAFQDRVFGFVGTINFTEAGVLDYCNFPSA